MIEYDEFLNYFHSHEAHIDEDSLASLGSIYIYVRIYIYIYIPIIYLLQNDQNAGFSWQCWIARGFFGVLAGSKKLKKALCFSLKQENHEVHLSILVLASSARKFRMSQSTVIHAVVLAQRNHGTPNRFQAFWRLYWSAQCCFRTSGRHVGRRSQPSNLPKHSHTEKMVMRCQTPFLTCSDLCCEKIQ